MSGGQLVLSGVGELFVTVGLVLLLFCVYQLVWTNVEADRRQDRVADRLADDWRKPGPTAAAGGTAAASARASPSCGSPASARTSTSRWSRACAREDLSRGVGHYPQTARPGEVGNFGVAGHRATNGEPFRDLDQVRRGDALVVETETSWFTYVVDRTRIVKPTRRLGDRPGARPPERDADGGVADADHLQPAVGVHRAADRLQPPRGDDPEDSRPAGGAGGWSLDVRLDLATPARTVAGARSR